jgi:SAM-dependent methyltransferase
MSLVSRLTSRRAVEAARRYFTDEELAHAVMTRSTVTLFDAVFRVQGERLVVHRVPEDVWLKEHVTTLPEEEAVWEVAAFVKVRRVSTAAEIVSRARTGALYDESYFTKRGGGAPYVGYPRELNGFQGNFQALADEINGRYTPKRLLDVGCATGHLVKALRDAGVEAEGIDFSEWAVENSVTPVIRGSALELPWEAGDFDTVISQDFMEHMHPDDLAGVIAEQVRVVRLGGTIAHLIPFYDTDPPVQVDAHLCQATKEWWMRFLRSQPNVEMVREPDIRAAQILDRYVELRRT